MKIWMRVLSLVLVLLLLSGCAGGGDDGENDDCRVNFPDVTHPSETEGTTQIPTETNPTEGTELTESETEAPTEQHTEAPAEAPTEAPTEAPAESPTEPPVEITPNPIPEQTSQGIGDVKAMWLSQYDLSGIYQSGGVQRSQADFTEKMGRVLDDLVELGFNTVFLQVRPNGDSMYPSEYYPMSKYVVGQYGVSAAYDPVEIVVRLAKDRGLAIHAWINPMRCMTDGELKAVPDKYPIRQWYNDPNCRGTRIVQSGNYWYLNPAYPEVRDLIVAAAAEVLSRYEFDGLHMDDYFYPTTDEGFDSAAYQAYVSGGGKLSLADFRRDALNRLVSELYCTAKSCGNRMFGISPAGNINTVYENQYADVYTWCAESGYIDYICPQVYFGLEHQNFDFKKVCGTWQSIIKSGDVALLIGMTFGKAQSGVDNYAGSGKNEWKEHKDILMRCLQHTATLEKCTGVAVFCYQYYCDPVSGIAVSETAEEWKNFVPALKNITWTQ